jgi:hypothetical protein
MSQLAARVDDPTARAREADRRQAAIYRRMLGHQRAAIEKQLAMDAARLATEHIAGDLRTIKRLKQGIRLKQTERDTLNRLIAALEQRLTTPG